MSLLLVHLHERSIAPTQRICQPAGVRVGHFKLLYEIHNLFNIRLDGKDFTLRFH